MQKNRIVVIDEPLHIPGVVYELERFSKQINEPIYTLLDHQEESCIIRGVDQSFSGDFQEDYRLCNSIPEIKRQDGGNSWYHGGTTCLLKTFPKKEFPQKAHTKTMEDWHKQLQQLYTSYSGEELFYDRKSADLYVDRDFSTQLMGTSQYNSIMRACWYESGVSLDEISELVKRDPQVENLNDFRESLGFVKQGFFHYLEYVLGFQDKMSSHEFISNSSLEKALLLQQKQGSLVGPCVSGKYGKKIRGKEYYV